MERRKYIRLGSVFPVALQFILSGEPEGRLYQGFTRDVSIDGLCIEIGDLDAQAQNSLRNPQIKLRLMINMPLSSRPSRATAKVAWTETSDSAFPKTHLIGIQYEDIDQKAKKRIFAYARRVRNIPRYVAAVTAVLVVVTAFTLALDFKIRRESRLLIEKTVRAAKRYGQLEQKMWLANRKEEKLKGGLKQSIDRQKQLEAQILKLEETIEQAHNLQEQKLTELLQEKKELEQALDGLKAEKALLDGEFARLVEEKAVLTTDLTAVKKESQGLKRSALQNMYRWLKTHQVHNTGLVTSFEGDKFLENWAFTYDQSLSAQVFTLFGDYERARKILDFYKHRAEKVNGGFVNAYEAGRGNVNEYVVHCGPNIWLGIAVLQYTNKSQDTQYLDLAQSIADWAIAIQKQDKEFGIRGGPQVSWFSTEHNLDAYALFNMLHITTGQRRYQLAAQRSLKWLRTHAYNGAEPPINRGKGDATIATDTFSWSICSLGPQVLLQDGMDPEQIIKYAEDNCAVTVQYQRPEGETVSIRGFDFSKYTHLPRGGIVSPEWTAQMIVAYQVMADYFFRKNAPAKADFYRQKSNFYLNELSKMLICSPSKTGQGEGCLPYATAANSDTGHGWRTPKGNRTGSLAATAYTIFASRGYNPLFLARQNRGEPSRNK